MTSDQCSAYRPRAEHLSHVGWTALPLRANIQENQWAPTVRRVWLQVQPFHRRRDAERRFGLAMASRNIAGRRTGDLSLAPKLIAEGNNV
jgi:hypothetical protein